LAQAHPEIYKEMLEQEKANDEQLGKKWLDIDGTTGAGELDLRPDTSVKHDSQASNQRENEGYNGGEA
jgi:hypothetical protein